MGNSFTELLRAVGNVTPESEATQAAQGPPVPYRAPRAPRPMPRQMRQHAAPVSDNAFAGLFRDGPPRTAMAPSALADEAMAPIRPLPRGPGPQQVVTDLASFAGEGSTENLARGFTTLREGGSEPGTLERALPDLAMGTLGVLGMLGMAGDVGSAPRRGPPLRAGPSLAQMTEEEGFQLGGTASVLRQQLRNAGRSLSDEAWFDRPMPIRDIELNRLRATEHDPDRLMVQHYADNPSPDPIAVRWRDGGWDIMDGHHRTAGARLRGDPTIQAYDASEYFGRRPMFEPVPPPPGEPVTPIPQSPARVIGPGGLPIREPQPFRQSFVGGTQDLNDAARMQSPPAPVFSGLDQDFVARLEQRIYNLRNQTTPRARTELRDLEDTLARIRAGETPIGTGRLVTEPMRAQRDWERLSPELSPEQRQQLLERQSRLNNRPDPHGEGVGVNAAFRGMSREEFLGRPRITTNRNAADLRPKALTSVADQPERPFLNRFTVRMSPDGAAVYDGDKVIASYNFGDTLVVDKAYRGQGIAEELVYQWRTAHPGPAVARERTRGAQRVQERVWDRIQADPDTPPGNSRPPPWNEGPRADMSGGDMPAFSRRSRGIIAYHGSPHDFDRFDMSRIGTGEGAQAYGHGLYFAENEGVARAYRDTLAGMAKFDWMDSASPETMAGGAVAAFGRHGALRRMEQALRQPLERDTAQVMRQAQELIRRNAVLPSPPPGRMYQVRINADPGDFLDWDAPLRQHPPTLQAPIRQLVADNAAQLEPNSMQAKVRGFLGPDAINDLSGRQLYGRLGETLPAGKAADELRSAGIPGIRYLDQGSRGVGDGTRNYVVFDDSLIEILRKYGLAGLAYGGAGGAAVGTQQNAPGR